MPGDDGAAHFDMDVFCPACVLMHYLAVLKKAHPSLTDADLAGRPLFADYLGVDELRAGLTVVKARAGSNIGARGARGVEVPAHVMVITHEEELKGRLYRGERLCATGDRFALARVLKFDQIDLASMSSGAPGEVTRVEAAGDAAAETAANVASGGACRDGAAVGGVNCAASAGAGGVAAGAGGLAADSVDAAGGDAAGAAATANAGRVAGVRAAGEHAAGAARVGAAADGGGAGDPAGEHATAEHDAEEEELLRAMEVEDVHLAEDEDVGGKRYNIRGVCFEMVTESGESIFVRPWGVVRACALRAAAAARA
jgi:hypothetical protein